MQSHSAPVDWGGHSNHLFDDNTTADISRKLMDIGLLILHV